MENHKFLFIGGLHRSGTTSLAKCLQAHPQISGFENNSAPKDEGQHLQSRFSPAREYGGAGIFGCHTAAYPDEQSPLVTAAHREKLFNEWQPYWDLSKPVLLEKLLPILILTRFYRRFVVHKFEGRATPFGYSFTDLGGQTLSHWRTTQPIVKEG